jgi:hypothetical protein
MLNYVRVERFHFVGRWRRAGPAVARAGRSPRAASCGPAARRCRRRRRPRAGARCSPAGAAAQACGAQGAKHRWRWPAPANGSPPPPPPPQQPTHWHAGTSASGRPAGADRGRAAPPASGPASAGSRASARSGRRVAPGAGSPSTAKRVWRDQLRSDSDSSSRPRERSPGIGPYPAICAAPGGGHRVIRLSGCRCPRAFAALFEGAVTRC